MAEKKKIEEGIKKAPVKKKAGLPKGRTNNPNGRPKGSKNKVHYDVKKAIAEKVCTDEYVEGIFKDIDDVFDKEKRAKLKIELVKLFVPRPLNDDEQKDSDIRSAMYAKLAGEITKETED
ncbi:MAG: hypothetical protein PHV07_09670 [Oscillospiraceae bacterium]|nr:hypothetical protein [Oscillospiraceae bacterium]